MAAYDWLIVGAGFTGAVIAERLASERDAKVLVIDRRDHIAGNAYDGPSEAGVRMHRYGPHIFHTNSSEVAAYLSRFSEWRPYEHRVLGRVDGALIPIPFNLTSLEMLFASAEARRLAKLLIDTYGEGTTEPILKMRQSQDRDIADLADFIYENVFLGYTRKQWGLEPEQLSPSVTARVPVRIGRDDRYFTDSYQNMPRDGYTRMFERILGHPNIDVSLETDFKQARDQVRHRRILFTGAIDEFFDYALGELPYRSMRFEPQAYRQRRRQPVAQINYPVSHDFTRTTEMGHLTREWGEVTTVVTEYPEPHRPGETEPHYPVPREENRELHRRYRELAAQEAPHVVFAGRLGDYQYYNMDQAVGRALSLYRKTVAAG